MGKTLGQDDLFISLGDVLGGKGVKSLIIPGAVDCLTRLLIDPQVHRLIDAVGGMDVIRPILTNPEGATTLIRMGRGTLVQHNCHVIAANDWSQFELFKQQLLPIVPMHHTSVDLDDKRIGIRQPLLVRA